MCDYIFLRLELYTAAAATQGDLLLEGGGGLLTPPGSSQARATLKTTTVLPFDELVFLQMVTDTTYAHEFYGNTFSVRSTGLLRVKLKLFITKLHC